MHFSAKVQYGLQAILELARRANSGPMKSTEISVDQKIPARYLEQLLLFLKRKGLVKSSRGREGGYAIARHPSDISLLEVIEALDGPIDLVGKKLKRSAQLLEVFSGLQGALKKHLAEITLEDIILRI
ncbi:MAG: Rrf2 family transcriptional regulator, partial [Candidatus Margulisiibacteriota bacterium]